MEIEVIIATKGRPQEVRHLIQNLLDQTRRPDRLIVVGAAEEDFPDDSPNREDVELRFAISPKVGLAAQRNCGVALSLSLAQDSESWKRIIVFFDDDFRPAKNWLKECAAFFARRPQCPAVTGVVVADGVKGRAIEERHAAELCDAQDTEAQGREIIWPRGLYGCNMAMQSWIFASCRFDENLPFYSWLEDTDMSGQIRRLGPIYKSFRMTGVHLGVKAGRLSGVRYGYSQIANPIYLWHRKRTVSAMLVVHLLFRALGSNAVQSIREHPLFDYRGRLKGNLIAIGHLLMGKLHPAEIRSI